MQLFRNAGYGIARSTVKCADSLSRVLHAIWTGVGQKPTMIDAWGVSNLAASFNFRLMRDSNAHLRCMPMAVPLIFHPTRFPMGRSAPLFAPKCSKAFADEGWVNLPRDRMHFQAARI